MLRTSYTISNMVQILSSAPRNRIMLSLVQDIMSSRNILFLQSNSIKSRHLSLLRYLLSSHGMSINFVRSVLLKVFIDKFSKEKMILESLKPILFGPLMLAHSNSLNIKSLSDCVSILSKESPKLLLLAAKIEDQLFTPSGLQNTVHSISNKLDLQASIALTLQPITANLISTIQSPIHNIYYCLNQNELSKQK